MPEEVVEIVPAEVVDIVPAAVVEMVPVLVVEIVPLFDSAGIEQAKVMNIARRIDLKCLMVFSW